MRHERLIINMSLGLGLNLGVVEVALSMGVYRRWPVSHMCRKASSEPSTMGATIWRRAHRLEEAFVSFLTRRQSRCVNRARLPRSPSNSTW